MQAKPIPNPRTEYGVIKRYLHVLALLQNKKDPQNWNGSTLADMLSLDEADSTLSDKTVREYISEYLEKEMGIDITRIKGGRRTELTTDLEGELLQKLAMLYATFVVHDSSREFILKNFIVKHPFDCLWILARIYFASLEKRKIRFNYTTNTGYKITNALFHPYHIFLRNNNLYLYGKIHSEPSPWLFILNRIENLTITDEFFNEDIPLANEVFKDSLGSFIGKKYQITLRFTNQVFHQIEELLAVLEPKFEKLDSNNWLAHFAVSDDTYLCKQLLLYGAQVEIIEPSELRATMIGMLKESLEVYEPH